MTLEDVPTLRASNLPGSISTSRFAVLAADTSQRISAFVRPAKAIIAPQAIVALTPTVSEQFIGLFVAHAAQSEKSEDSCTRCANASRASAGQHGHVWTRSKGSFP